MIDNVKAFFYETLVFLENLFSLLTSYGLNFFSISMVLKSVQKTIGAVASLNFILKFMEDKCEANLLNLQTQLEQGQITVQGEEAQADYAEQIKSLRGTKEYYSEKRETLNLLADFLQNMAEDF